MSIPSNVVQQDGIGTVTADNYNTYVQTVSFSDGLVNFVGADGMTVYIPGLTTFADGGQGDFYWNSSGTANDGVNNIQPNGVSVGCWTRVPFVVSGSTGPVDFVNAVNFADGGNIASASTTAIGAAAGNNVTITGTTTITAFDTVQAGAWREVTFAGSLVLTYNATSMRLPTAANITTAAGDTAGFLSLGSGNWICMWYQRANGQALSSSSFNAGVQVFTASGTYTPTSGMRYVTAQLCGGGGGSAGCSGANTGAAGGGGGGYASVLLTAAQIGVSQAITIGAGGTAGDGSTSGGSGGTTSIGSLVSCTGGAGGLPGAAQVASSTGGTATVNTGATLLALAGGASGNGAAIAASFAVGGAGGTNPLGIAWPMVGPISSGSLDGILGSGYGIGASGASSGPTGSAQNGHVGAPGVVIITEFFS